MIESVKATGHSMIHDTKSGENNEMVYLRGEHSWGQKVRDMDYDRRTSPVTLGKQVDACDSQGHQSQLPAVGETRHTLGSLERSAVK